MDKAVWGNVRDVEPLVAKIPEKDDLLSEHDAPFDDSRSLSPQTVNWEEDLQTDYSEMVVYQNGAVEGASFSDKSLEMFRWLDVQREKLLESRVNIRRCRVNIRRSRVEDAIKQVDSILKGIPYAEDDIGPRPLHRLDETEVVLGRNQDVDDSPDARPELVDDPVHDCADYHALLIPARWSGYEETGQKGQDTIQVSMAIGKDLQAEEAAYLYAKEDPRSVKASDRPHTAKILGHINRTVSKAKRGLSGFANGSRISAFPDTGSYRNIVSEAFVQELKLTIANSPCEFKLGNSKKIQSIGTVRFDWAFSECAKDTMNIVCDVLPICNYKLILGSAFLTATETLSKHKRRLTECIFTMTNVLRFNLLGGHSWRLPGCVGHTAALAMPDTGAEANVMDESFANENGFLIDYRYCNTLQFADGSCQDTIGQVHTDWTFKTGLSMPVTFEVLENCCAEVVIGNSILYEHNVFEDDAYSMVDCRSENDTYNLAPFDLVKGWHQKLSTVKDHIVKSGTYEDKDKDRHHHNAVEDTRREAWNYQYSFGKTASDAEKLAERQRRADHDRAMKPLPPIPSASARTVHQVTNTPTAQNPSQGGHNSQSPVSST